MTSPKERLRAAYAAAGAWEPLAVTTGQGGGFDGVQRTWLHVLAVKGA